MGPASWQEQGTHGKHNQKPSVVVPATPTSGTVSSPGPRRQAGVLCPRHPRMSRATLSTGWEAGARASTIKVVAAAIAHNHKDAGFDVPLRHGVARTVFEDLTQDDSPVPTRALPLDLDFYRAIRKTAYEPRSGRVGRMERATNARRRGALDVAMIGLMRDARLPGGEATALIWGDLERAPGVSGRVRVGEVGFRVVSADTMKLVVVSPPGSRRQRAALGNKTQPDSDTGWRGGETHWTTTALTTDSTNACEAY